MTKRSQSASTGKTSAGADSYDQVTVTDPRLDDKKLLLAGIDVSAGPTFTVSEAAKVFFGRTSHWIRLNEANGNLALDGVAVGSARTSSGARVYTLADIELMAHALMSHHTISGAQLNNALLVVSTIARIWAYI